MNASRCISISVEKHCYFYSTILCELFNMSISSGVIPQEWKMSNVISIHKSGGKTEVNNYCPISLLCIIYLARCLRSIHPYKMLAFIDSTRFLSDDQWGLRPATPLLLHLRQLLPPMIGLPPLTLGLVWVQCCSI